MTQFLSAIVAFVIAVLGATSGAAFDEIDQTGQNRFKAMKSCSGCHLLQAPPGGKVKMIGANLKGVDLRRLNLEAADLRRADLRGVNLEKVNLAKARLKGALLRGANLKQADLQGAGLAWAILRDANLNGADLRGADLTLADLTRAPMENAQLHGAILCRTTMPSGVIKNPDCQWWKAERQSDDSNETAEITANPLHEAFAPPRLPAVKPAGKSDADFNITAYLGRMFSNLATIPDHAEASSR
ncbi:MAG: pentapeptide repeat-containing protein [Proteobacteria bacterium]|nr:pentapeptide repeat-containing protein [Pseudomonadota bacterium]